MKHEFWDGALSPCGSVEPRAIGSVLPLALLVSDRPISGSPPGQARRLESLVAYLEGCGFQVKTASVAAASDGLAMRALKALTWCPPTWAGGQRAELTLVAGLGAPHMLALARRLSWAGEVAFDACDSWILQLHARRSSGEGRILPSLVGIALAWLPSRIRYVTYIAQRDLERDAVLHARGDVRACVVSQVAPPELKALSPVGYPLKRIVVPADFTSFHNQGLLKVVERGLAEFVRRSPNVSIHMFGKTPDGYLPPAGVSKGWADSLADLYAGDTGVIVTNVSGSGVPNKYLEAIHAGRPVAMHRSLDYLKAGATARVYLFDDEDSLVEALGEMVTGKFRAGQGVSPD